MMSNIFQNLPTVLDTEVFETIAASSTVKIERIVSLGHTTPQAEWYDQEQNEWVILLQGAAVLSFADGGSIRLQPGDYVNLAAHQKHRVDWTDPQALTIWLAIFY